MPSNPPFPVAPEQRLLAAIVFTDASGYSARAHAEETAAVRLVEDDFTVMRNLSRELSGTVLKSTGDGLLICFTSAVHAVEWALRMQRIFAGRGPSRERGEVFRHRVGIHVGDVFLKTGDVMGDGVNIAARVQAEAPPGGICISQTVFDIVKNKMELHVIRLEPRKLKNIREQIQLYHVLLEEPKRPETPAATLGAPSAVVPVPATRRTRGVPVAFAILLMIGLGIALMLRVDSAHEKDLAESQAERQALGAMLARPEPTAPDPAAPEGNPPPAFDFAALTTSVAHDTAANGGDEATRARAMEAVMALQRWAAQQLSGFTRDRPLAIRELGGAMQDSTVYSDAPGRVVYVAGRGEIAREWATLPPAKQGAIILGMLRVAPDPVARRNAEAFAYLHGLPELASALVSERRRETLFR